MVVEPFSVWIKLPEDMDRRLEKWSEGIPAASRDPSGSHVTILTFQSAASRHLIEQRIRDACCAICPFGLQLKDALIGDYWGKQDLKIVMLVGESQVADGVSDRNRPPAGGRGLRERILQALQDIELELMDEGAFVPHLTLTTGASAPDAAKLHKSAAVLSLDFDVYTVRLSMPGKEIILTLGG